MTHHYPPPCFAPDGTIPTIERELVDVRRALARACIVGVEGEANHFRDREAATVTKLEHLCRKPLVDAGPPLHEKGK